MSEWFGGAPTLKKQPMQTVRVTWPCPKEGCEGEMQFNGYTWLTNPGGYHHTCTVCKYTAALSGKKYPSIEYEVLGEARDRDA